MKKRLRSLLIFLFISFLGVGGILLGALSSNVISTEASNRYTDLQLFSKVLNLAQKYYVEEVDLKKLVEGGIKGMLNELDPHSNYLPPEIYKEFEAETSGKFGGLGIEITVQKGLLTIISPIEDTPAWEAGLKPGDIIVGIDGTSTKGLSLVEAAKLMRGKIGVSVVLKIMREGLEKPKDYKITRGSVKLNSIKYTDLENGHAYIRITSFIENSAKDLRKALKKHKKKHKEIKGLIIDLRHNPGGLLDQAVKISDMFLSEGVIVSTIGRDKSQEEVVKASKSKTLGDFPVIILINEYSASASEILAGALQDNKRALIMGKVSFGKGSVQSVIKLGDGSGLKLTVARYYTPSGRSIQAEGISPDVAVEAIDVEAFEKAAITGPVRKEKDMAGHLGKGKKYKKKDGVLNQESLLYWRNFIKDKKEKNLSGKEKLLSRDYQALQAYNYLKAWRVMRSFQGEPQKAPEEKTSL